MQAVIDQEPGPGPSSLAKLVETRRQDLSTVVDSLDEPFQSRARAELEVQSNYMTHLHMAMANPRAQPDAVEALRKDLRLVLDNTTPAFYFALPLALSEVFGYLDALLVRGESLGLSRDRMERAARAVCPNMLFLKKDWLLSAPKHGVPPRSNAKSAKLVTEEGNATIGAVNMIITKRLDQLREEHGQAQGGGEGGGGEQQDEAQIDSEIEQAQAQLHDPTLPTGSMMNGTFVVESETSNYIAHVAAHNYVENGLPGAGFDPDEDLGILLMKKFVCRARPIYPPRRDGENENGNDNESDSGGGDSLKVHWRAPSIAVKIPLVYTSELKMQVLGHIFGADWAATYPAHMDEIRSVRFVEEFMSRKKAQGKEPDDDVLPVVTDYNDLGQKRLWTKKMGLALAVALLWQIGLDRVFDLGEPKNGLNPTSIQKLRFRMADVFGIYLITGEGSWMGSDAGPKQQNPGSQDEDEDDLKPSDVLLVSPPIVPYPGQPPRTLFFNLERLRVPHHWILDKLMCRWYRNGFVVADQYRDLSRDQMTFLLREGGGPVFGYPHGQPWKGVDVKILKDGRIVRNRTRAQENGYDEDAIILDG